jgi:hypothetical protein
LVAHCGASRTANPAAEEQTTPDEPGTPSAPLLPTKQLSSAKADTEDETAL